MLSKLPRRTAVADHRGHGAMRRAQLRGRATGAGRQDPEGRAAADDPSRWDGGGSPSGAPPRVIGTVSRRSGLAAGGRRSGARAPCPGITAVPASTDEQRRANSPAFFITAGGRKPRTAVCASTRRFASASFVNCSFAGSHVSLRLQLHPDPDGSAGLQDSAPTDRRRDRSAAADALEPVAVVVRLLFRSACRRV